MTKIKDIQQNYQAWLVGRKKKKAKECQKCWFR
jgi:CRISPR/Cas system-associated exonuclease Cas4 (RecB family)